MLIASGDSVGSLEIGAHHGTSPHATCEQCPQQIIYGGDPARRITMRDLQLATEKGQRWPMITAYDALSAGVFDEAGIPALLVGDSAGMVVFGHDTTIAVTVDELLMLVRAVVKGSKRALVVADLPFGSYQASPAQALATAVLFMQKVAPMR